jgi:hypothetical protein
VGSLAADEIAARVTKDKEQANQAATAAQLLDKE